MYVDAYDSSDLACKQRAILENGFLYCSYFVDEGVSFFFFFFFLESKAVSVFVECAGPIIS